MARGAWGNDNRRANAWLAAVLAIAAALAGCAGVGHLPAASHPVLPDIVPAAALAGSFYQFHHPGGTLELGVSAQGHAEIELFDPHDLRLGRLLLGGLAGHVGPVAVNDLVPGDYVLHVVALNGTLQLSVLGQSGSRSGETSEPVLRPLASHLERRILRQEPGGAVPVVGGLPPINQTPHVVPLNVTLLRAPTALRLLATGPYSDLSVQLRGASGLVVDYNGGQRQGLNTFGGGVVEQLPAQLHPEAAADGHLVGSISFTQLQGAIVLEATSYSRLLPRAPATAAVLETSPAGFSYGSLPEQPVRFQLGAQNHRVLVANNLTEPAWASLFTVGGDHLGTIEVPGHSQVALPLTPGPYIVALLSGNLTLGADSAPGDFDLHPLTVTRTLQPATPAGRNGEYGQSREAADKGGVVFDIRPASSVPMQGSGPVPLPAFSPCRSEGMVRVVGIGNETLAYWDFASQVGRAAPLLDGPATIETDGFGADGCERSVAEVLSFHL